VASFTAPGFFFSNGFIYVKIALNPRAFVWLSSVRGLLVLFFEAMEPASSLTRQVRASKEKNLAEREVHLAEKPYFRRYY
jgi:hypothetical protein